MLFRFSPLQDLRTFTATCRKDFLSLLFLFFITPISAQVLDITVSSPGNLSTCGPTSSLTVTVEATGAVTTTLTGAVLSFDAIAGLEVTPSSVNIGDITAGYSEDFMFTISANCNFATNISSSVEIPFTVTHDPYGLGGDDSASGESNTIQIQEPDLSIGSTDPVSVSAFFGQTFTVDVSVNNGGNGELEEFMYCVTGNDNVTLTRISVAGVVTAGPGPCFTIDMDELTAAGEFPFFDTSIEVQETWEVIGCESPSDPVSREISFGCTASPDCDSDDSSTGLIFGVAIPDLDASVTAMDYPACYADVDSDVQVTITNNGLAPADTIYFRINANQDIDLGSITATDMGGDNVGILSIDDSSVDGCDGSVVYLHISDANLANGECIEIDYTISHDCACNDCAKSGIYGNSVTVSRWTDYCDNDYDSGTSASVSGYNANLDGFVEGPTELLDGETSIIEYTLNSITLDWMNSTYPDAYLEIEYEIPCGLDYIPGTAVWTDRDGTVWSSCSENYVDSDLDHSFVVRFCQADQPGGFSISAGSSFTLEVTPDCGEKTIPMDACGVHIFDLVIDQTTYFSTDENCTMACERQKIWDPDELDIRVSCPVGGGCVCEGLEFSQFTMERTTLGLGDSNNDQVPDGAIDRDLIQLDRFLQGDTIKAFYQGLVNNTMGEVWRYGFATLDFDHTNFTPISAQLIFHDDSEGTIDTINTIPISVSGMDLILDWSLDTLNALGAGIDPSVSYQDGDSISLCVNFQIKEPFSNMEQTVEFNPTLYLSDDEYGVGSTLSCNDRVGRLTQVGLTTGASTSFGNFGACNLPSWRIEYRRHYGGRTFDEFPYEIRAVGLPKTISFTKPSEFEYRLDEFEVELRQMIIPANNIVTRSVVIPEAYFLQNGDELIFLAEDFFNSLGESEIPPDEGYRIRYYPRVQGGCKSTAGDYEVIFSATESVDEGVYCTPTLTRDPDTVTVSYTGGAELEIEAAETNVVLCSGVDTVDLLVNSVQVPDAVNAFLYWNSGDGGAVVTKLIDGDDDTEILPNDFGIFPLGDIDGGTSKSLRALVIVNDCASTTIDFVAGWDCESLPTTVDEALCSDPSTISYSAAPSGMNLNVLAPVNDTIVDFCDPIPYEIEIISTELGYLRDFEIIALLPPGQEYQSGSLEMAYPSVAEGGTYVNVGMDPVINGVIFRLNVAELDPDWVENGLIGAKDLDRNKISLRFVTETTCGYISGEQARFILLGSDNCGDPIRTVRKRSRRAFVTSSEPSFEGDITLSDLVINPCNQQEATSFVSFELTSGGPTAVLDSIQYVLPEGLNYKANSYSPVLNMPNGEPVIRDQGGFTVLSWPMNVGLMIGDVASFRIDLESTDVGQLCGTADLVVSAYSSVNALCGTMDCAYGIEAGREEATLTIEKPELSFNNFNGALSFASTTTELLQVFDVEICNTGATLQSGQSVTLDIYEDEDNNGFRSGSDTYLFSVTEVLASPLSSGDCVTLSGESTFPSGTVCTVIGVLDPSNTCVCSEEPSGQFSPEFIIDFDTEVETCSGSTLSVGSEAIDGFDYTWLSYNSSPLSALSATDQTPVDFTMVNTTDSDITLQYILRSTANNCYEYDTLSITLGASYYESFDVIACLNGSYTLPSPGLGGSNFQWTPSTGLTFPGPDSSYAVIDTVMGDETYTLNFLGADSCTGTMVVKVGTLDCGTAAASLGDYVWFDFDRDGVQEESELPIAGIEVNLYDALTASLLGTTTTDENGYYIFDDLPQGTYYVDFDPLPGFTGTLADQGSGVSQDSLDSDADATTGITPTYTLAWGEHNPTIDAGFIPTCVLEIDLSVSDCIVEADTLTREVTIDLTWAGNPYTYDQFFGEDTIYIDLAALGQELAVVVDTVMGDTSLTILVNPNSTTSLTADARFAYADVCTATSETVAFDPCIFDLALKKESTNGSSFSYGDTICLDIIVFNQAIQPASNIDVIDYLPDGFGFLEELNPDWTSDAGNLRATITDTLLLGESDTIPLKLSLLMATGSESWTNYAEITAFEDTLGNDRSAFDIDSTPDEMVDNDPGGKPETPSDDVVNGNGSGSPGDTDPGTDEDDHDPFKVEIFDLALQKVLVSEPPYAYGQEVTFAITVYNQGNIIADSVELSDYIPTGFDWVASNEPAWSVEDAIAADKDTATTVIADTIQPGGSRTVNISLMLLDAEPDQYINFAEISMALDTAGNARFDDIDSTPDNDIENDAGGNPGSDSDDVVTGDGSGSPNGTDPAADEDDQDPAFISIPLIDLTKTTTSVLPASSGTTGNFDVTFQFQIVNSGNTKLTAIQLIDNFPSIFGSAYVQLVSSPTVVEMASTVSVGDRPTLNTNFNGAAFDSLFVGTDGCMAADDTLTLQLAIETTALTGVDSVINKATVTAQDTFSTPTMDMDTAKVEIPTCFLDVICPSAGTTLSCLADLPTAANNAATFNAIDGGSAIRNSCGVVTIQSSDSDNGGTGCSLSPLIITREYIIIDNGGVVEQRDTCEITYTIIDDELPVLVCPSAIEVDCGIDEVTPYVDLSAFEAAGGYAADDCGISSFAFVSDVSDNGSCPEVFSRTYRVRDACDNESTCVQLITVNDETGPVLSCPAIDTDCALSDIPAYADLDAFLADGNTVTDNCAIDSMSFQLVSETTDGNTCPQIVQRKYSLADSCGNVAFSTQIITIDDETDPVFTMAAPQDTTIDCSATLPAAVILTATDNCTTPSVVFTETSTQTDLGACSDYSYTITRQWVATDACDNFVVETQVVTVQDTTPPTVSCCAPFSISIGTEVDGVIDLTAEDLNCGSSDDCTPDSLLRFEVEPSSFTAADIDTHAVTLRVYDLCGNVDSCTIDVIITEKPALGIAKRVVSVVNNEDGTGTVTYEFNVENFGDVDLDSLQVTDTLTNTFTGTCSVSIESITSDDFIVNSNFGQSNDWNLLNGLEEISAGDKGAILLTITVDNCGTNQGPYNNIATATAVSPGDSTLTDLSVDGSDPDGVTKDDDPEESSPTPVTFEENPAIGLSKRNVGVTNNGDGSYKIIYEINVANYGDVRLDSIQVLDSLDQAFPSPCVVSTELTSEAFSVNESFGQAGDWRLLNGTDQLGIDQEGAILLAVTVTDCASTGIYTNTAIAEGVSPDGNEVEDDSVDGSDPDPNGDGNPDEESDTEATLSESPSLGAAKRVTQVTNNGDGSYTVTYEISLENFGDVDLDSLQAIDTLANVFTSPCELTIDEVTSSHFSVNSNYGQSEDWNLLTGVDPLRIGERGAILLTITVDNCGSLGPFINQVEASAVSPFGTSTTDDSTNGSDPDGSDEDDTPDEDAPTPVSFTEDPVLGLAKRVSDGPHSNGDGTYSLTFEVRVENNGNVNLDSLQVGDDLAAVFASDCDWEIDGLSSEEFTLNDNYDGQADTLLLRGDDELKSWDEGAIYIQLTVGPCTDLGPFRNSATGIAKSPVGEEILDVSQTGSEPDPDGDGETDDNDVPTEFEFDETPLIGAAKRVSSVVNNGDGSYTVTYEFGIENFGDVLLDSIQLVDTLNTVFADPCELTIDELTSDDFAVNENYGNGDDWSLLVGTDDLPIGDRGAILLTITVDNCGDLGPFINQAFARGVSPTGEEVTDESTNGSDPDGSDDDNDPDEDATTSVSFEEDPVLGLAKRVSYGPISNGDGTYSMTFEIRVENNGNINLDSLQVGDDLAAVFGSDCDWTIDGLSSDEFTVNDNYDGQTDTLLLRGDDELKSWDEGAIYLQLQVGPCSDLGPVTNTATGTAKTPVGEEIVDVSQTGSEPDSDGDGDTNDNDEPTEFEFDETPVIGGAKRVTMVENNGDGSYTVTYEFNIENFGDVDLDSIQLVDDLSMVFASPCDLAIDEITSDDLTVNENYGVGGDWKLLRGTDDLPLGDQSAILLTITVDNCGDLGPFLNQALVSGVSPAGETVTDDTTNGSDPDGSDEDDNPDEDASTSVSFEEDPVLGLSKRVSQGPLSNGDGTYSLTFEIRVENNGNINLDSLQVTDDLADVFDTDCSWQIDGTASEEFTINEAYNGDSNTELLRGDDELKSWNEGAIYVHLTVGPCSDLGPFTNSATGTAKTPIGEEVMDISQTGSEPDPDGDGETDDNDVATEFEFEENPVIGGAKRVTSVVNNGDGSYQVTYEFNIENFGDVELDSVQIADDLSTVFGDPCELTIDEITSDDYAVNGNYGEADDWNLLAGTDDLPLGDKGAILLKITVDNCGSLGPFINRATVMAVSPTGEMITDETTNGSDADGADEDDTPDENASTSVSFDEDPVLGLAKRVSEGPASNGDGTYSLTFEIRVENNGNINLDSLQVTDDLAAVFTTDCDWTIDGLSSEEFTVNAAYDGVDDIELLRGDDELKNWNEGAIYIHLTVGPCTDLGPFVNSATGTAKTPVGEEVMDVSQTGSEPDPDGDGETDDNDVETEFVFEENPIIGVSKRAVEVINHSDGSATVTYEFNIENFGDVDLDSIQLVDSLDLTFPGPCAPLVQTITSGQFSVNADFDGTNDYNLLIGSNDLEVGEKGAILVKLLVENCGTNVGPFFNNAYVDAVSPTGEEVSDASTPGSDPDPNGDGNPAEHGPTIIAFEQVTQIGIAKNVVEAVTNSDGSFDIIYEFNIENFGTVELEEIQVFDTLTHTFPAPCQVEIIEITSDKFTVNDDEFDGINVFEMLEGNDILEVGNKGAILLDIHVTLCGENLGPFHNVARVEAVAPGDNLIEDSSSDGSEPDPNSDGTPDESSPTTVVFAEHPLLGVTKRISAGPSLDEEDYYVLTYEIRAQNFGDVDLEKLQLLDTLANTFLGAEDWMIVSIESEEFAINEDYDGISNNNLILENEILVVPGEEGAVYLTVRVAPGGEPGPYLNSVTGTAITPFGTVVSDVSQDGSDPDPNENDDPTDDNEETPVVLDCFVELVCPAVVDTIRAENDLGWCRATVNFPPAYINTCAGAQDSLIEYRLEGAGAYGIPSDTWLPGQPSGLMYQVGLTRVSMRASIPSQPTLGYSDTCIFHIEILDKEDPEILCQDITVGVGADCDYILVPERLDAGTTDNCDDPADLLFEISLDNVNYVSELSFGLDDLLSTPITVYLRVTDQAGNFATCTNEINLVDESDPQIICPPDQIIYTEENLCVGKVPNLAAEVTIDNCAPIDTVFQIPSAGTLFGTRHEDTLEVVLTVVDVFGNTDTCGVTLTLIDTIPPSFINCPQPDIKVNTLPGMCGAFVNFSLPVAADNCAVDEVVQTDETGLTSGDMFPVGTTILEFTAFDVARNSVVCLRKVIVNDKAGPAISCPQDVAVNMDAGDCGAVVNDIAPLTSDNCEDNLSVAFRLLDEQGGLIGQGMSDASGSFFPEGTTRVEYRLQDQPLLLISEVTHELEATIGGQAVVPSFITNSGSDDYLEITNHGPASMDVSCLAIERLFDGGSETYSVPRGAILDAGEVLTIHFGEGEDDPDHHYYNVPNAADLSAITPAAYILSHSGVTLDVAVIGQYFGLEQSTLSFVTAEDWTGITSPGDAGMMRVTVWDTDTGADFIGTEVCQMITIGSLNPGLSAAASNGTLTALQAQLPHRDECAFEVEVTDAEVPQCGAYEVYETYTKASGETIEEGDCLESIISIEEQYDIADLNVNIVGNTSSFGNLTFSLISPSGTQIELASNLCGSWNGFDLGFDSDAISNISNQCPLLSLGINFQPLESLETFNGEPALGDWILQIGHDGSLDSELANLLSWSLEISRRIPYPQQNVTLNTAYLVCENEYTWQHPVLFDNCAGGSIEVQYRDALGDLLGNGSIAEMNWGAEVARDFPLGENLVSYTLRDAAGNETLCEFTVTIIDEEPPVLDCPDDITRQLGPGECEATLPQLPNVAYDNCGITTVTYDPPLDHLFPIGVTQVMVTVEDASGNSNSCSFEVEVLEHVPLNPIVVCNDSLHLTLGPDCTAEVTADMILEGGDYRCYDSYEITIFASTEPNAPVIPTSPVLGMDQVGADVKVEICDPVTGQCCTSVIRIDFYQAPEFICPADIAVSCNADLSPSVLGEPIVTSCVPGGAAISYRDVIDEQDECDDPRVIIKRIWTVSDGAGNEATCNQVITIKAFDLAEIEFPADLDNINLPALDCEQVQQNSAVTHPDATGYPTVDGSTDVFGVNYCTASFIWSDEIFNICPGSYEILRTWKVRNSCQPVMPGLNPLEHIQVIKVQDFDGPDIICPDDMVVSTDPYFCTATVALPIPSVEDGCSNTTFSASVSAGYLIVVDGVFTVHQLPIGTHEVTFVGRDECGKTSSCRFTLTVEDQIEPVAVCNDDLHISVDGMGYARVFAADIDEGSNDNCGVDRIEVRREHRVDSNCEEVTPFMGDWGEFVEFDCCDVNDSILIELRVVDIHGNANVCWLEVLIEDKASPFCIPPHAVQMACDSLPYDLDYNDDILLSSLFGTATTSDNCGNVMVEELTPTVTVNDCGSGRVVRHFQAIDQAGNRSVNDCDQIVEIVDRSNYMIRFPKDASASCGLPEIDTIQTIELGCDLLAVNVVDEFFSASQDECYKILRTYQVINWCEYDGESDPVVIGRDEDCDGVTGDEDVWVIVAEDGHTYIDRDSLPGNAEPVMGLKGTSCDGTTNPSGHWTSDVLDPSMQSNGFWRYTQVIKVYDNDAPEVVYDAPAPFCTVNDASCVAKVSLPFAIDENCTLSEYYLELSLDMNADGQIDQTLDPASVLQGDFPNFTLIGEFPIGKHIVEVRITDGCGNRNKGDLAFEIVDCKAPTPICINGLAAELSPVAPGTDVDNDGVADPAAAIIYASDFIASEGPDCSGPITYSINRVGEDADPNQDLLILTCKDVGFLAIEIYAWDQAQNPYAVQLDGAVGGPNYDFCVTQVHVQDNNSICDGPGEGLIAGLIATEDDRRVEEVEVSLSGPREAVNVTAADGIYSFAGLELGGDYTVTPILDENYLNGVSTFDLIVISKHILGEQELSSPYRMIAADINRSKSITTIDVILMRRVILGIDPDFRGNTSWRFIDRSYDFPDPSRPWLEEFPELMSFNNLAEDQLNQDFVAVKVGDVNLNAVTNSLQMIEERSDLRTYSIELEDQPLLPGETYDLVLRASGLDTLQGFQFSLYFDPAAVELLSFEPGLLTRDNIGWQRGNKGEIHVSWHDLKPKDRTVQDLMTLRVRGKRPDQLSHVLALSASGLQAEAYTSEGQLMDIELSYPSSSVVLEKVQLFQNEPNPFVKRTKVRFFLPEKMPASLRFTDINGKLLKVISDEFPAGENEVTLERGTFKGHGIIYYTLIAGPETQTLKMIQLE